MGERGSPESSRINEEPETVLTKSRPEPSNLRNIAILIVGVAVSSLLAVLTMRSYVAPAIEQRRTTLQAETSSEEVELELEKLAFYKLDPLLVNPASSNGERYLRVTISLETQDRELLKEIEKRVPQIKNQINNVLSSKTMVQLQTTDARERLRREIQNRVNGLLMSGHISNVYFEEFVYQ
ncbi:MAG: flagellar basal body-associated FliL family protein [Candidatus Hydrogenedentota bacterium]|nr:MAG: flagellar basal body-associated FliL family protein [Candidatus Hydrogenedentota bacterium]